MISSSVFTFIFLLLLFSPPTPSCFAQLIAVFLSWFVQSSPNKLYSAVWFIVSRATSDSNWPPTPLPPHRNCHTFCSQNFYILSARSHLFWKDFYFRAPKHLISYCLLFEVIWCDQPTWFLRRGFALKQPTLVLVFRWLWLAQHFQWRGLLNKNFGK